MNKKIICYVVSFVVLIGICLILHHVYEKTDTYVSIIASAASVVGVTISIMEIVGVKSKTEAIEVSLKETRTSIGSFLTSSEVKKMSSEIDEIEAYLHSQKNELALLKLKDLKNYLCESHAYIKSRIQEIDDTYPDSDLQQVIFNLGMDVQTLHKVVNGLGYINYDVMFKNLENAKDVLGHIYGIIKSSKI